MAGLGAIVLNAAPLAGGVLLGGLTGKSGANNSDLRALIVSELELLKRIPEDEVARRAALDRMIAEHIDALIVAQRKSREFQRKTRYFTEHWRDVVLFITAVLFAVIVWQVDHHRPMWLPLVIATVAMVVVTAIYLVRGFSRSLRPAPAGDHGQRDGGASTAGTMRPQGR